MSVLSDKEIREFAEKGMITPEDQATREEFLRLVRP